MSELKPVDKEGQEILESISVADKFNEWMFKTIEPFCKGKILEIGSGIGNVSCFFLKNGFEILLTDLRDNYCEVLSTKFKEYKNLIGVKQIDLVAHDFEIKYADLIGTFDTVISLNVVEHIKDDKLAIINCKKLLSSGGQLIILVPSYGWLFNSFDISLEHYRRYDSNLLNILFANAELSVIHKQHFNATGIFGWWLMGNVFKKKIISGEQMKIYNTFMPIIKIIDIILLRKVGLSIIYVGQNK